MLLSSSDLARATLPCANTARPRLFSEIAIPVLSPSSCLSFSDSSCSSTARSRLPL